MTASMKKKVVKQQLNVWVSLWLMTNVSLIHYSFINELSNECSYIYGFYNSIIY